MCLKAQEENKIALRQEFEAKKIADRSKANNTSRNKETLKILYINQIFLKMHMNPLILYAYLIFPVFNIENQSIQWIQITVERVVFELKCSVNAIQKITQIKIQLFILSLH